MTRRLAFSAKGLAVGLFLSTYENKMDKKGRISLPAPFRTALSDEPFQGVILVKSQKYKALDGFTLTYMQDISQRVDNFDLFSNEQDDMATAIFAESMQLALDPDGRIIIPQELRNYAGLTDKTSFVGLGHKFQIWHPDALRDRKSAARQAVTEQGLTLPKTPNQSGRA